MPRAIYFITLLRNITPLIDADAATYRSFAADAITPLATPRLRRYTPCLVISTLRLPVTVKIWRHAFATRAMMMPPSRCRQLIAAASLTPRVAAMPPLMPRFAADYAAARHYVFTPLLSLFFSPASLLMPLLPPLISRYIYQPLLMITSSLMPPLSPMLIYAADDFRVITPPTPRHADDA